MGGENRKAGKGRIVGADTRICAKVRDCTVADVNGMESNKERTEVERDGLVLHLRRFSCNICLEGYVPPQAIML